MMSRFWSRSRDNIIGGIFAALALAVTAAVLLLSPGVSTSAAWASAVEHQKLVEAQIGPRGNQLAGSNDPGRSVGSPMSTIAPAPDYDSEPESVSRGTEP